MPAPSETPSQRFTRAALWALAREEAHGRRPARLTEPNLASWQRFRGRLTASDLARLVLEDGAVSHPSTFEAASILPTGFQLGSGSDALVEELLSGLEPEGLKAPSSTYLQEQAARLDIPTRFARSDLPTGIQPHHRVVELPGTGGLLAHHICSTREGVFLQDVFTVACGGWEERALAGLVALELGVVDAPNLRIDPDLSLTRAAFEDQAPDWVLGLSPKRGGRWTREELLVAFPGLTNVALV